MMRQALTKVPVGLLGTLLGLPDGIVVSIVRLTDEDVADDTVTLWLSGDGLPIECEGVPGERTRRVEIVYQSRMIHTVGRVIVKKEG